MNIIGDTSVPGASTAAITLPGTAGAADADLYLQVNAGVDISIELSDDGATWSTGPNPPPYQTPVPSGVRARLRNTNGAARVAYVSYRYAGQPS